MSSSINDNGPPEGVLQVGRVGRPHGVRGDVFIDLTTDREERAQPGARLWIAGQWRELSASAPANGRWRVHIDGIDDRDEASQLTGQFMYAEPIDDPDALWVHELIGAQVVEADGTDRGVCVAVVENPAHDLLELESGALVPARFITTADSNTITIDPPPGLFDD